MHPDATADIILFLVTYTYIQIDKFLHLQRNLSESPDKIYTLGLLNILGLLNTLGFIIHVTDFSRSDIPLICKYNTL